MFSTNSRARSIKTRIETSQTEMDLEEGDLDSRARSIKTRIETQRAARYVRAKVDSRARSIKTRIETAPRLSLLACFHLIREQDPLKQGLKLSYP